jgi:hypothetical protein
MRLELIVDGTKSLSGDLAGALRTRFDEVGFAASNNGCNFVIDNIEITSSPSPSTSDNRPPSVRGRCEPCAIGIGETAALTADAQNGGGTTLAYEWSAPTGRFGDPTARQTSWTGPMRRHWTEERWRKEGDLPIPITVTVNDGRGGTASDTVAVQVIRPIAK